MKKLFVLLTITCMSLSVNAQNYFGVKGMGGISVLTPGTYTHNPGINMGGGLAYKHQIFKRVSLEGDITFDLRSTTTPDVETGTTAEFNLSSSYISMPLTIQWHVPFRRAKLVPYRTEQSKSFWFLEGGPILGFGLGAITYLDPATPKVPSELTAGGFDVGVVGGIGLNFHQKNNLNRLIIGARASYGFLNYNKYAGAPAFNNIVAGGYVQYDFKLNKKRYYQYRW